MRQYCVEVRIYILYYCNSRNLGQTTPWTSISPTFVALSLKYVINNLYRGSHLNSGSVVRCKSPDNITAGVAKPVLGGNFKARDQDLILEMNAAIAMNFNKFIFRCGR
jgi:hypothetical protein